MPQVEALYVFAQMSISLAGFAGLLAFIRERSAGPLAKVQRVRVDGMVRGALFVAAFSLLPNVVSNFGGSESNVWRISGAAFALAALPFQIGAWKRRIWARSVGFESRVPFIPHAATLAFALAVASVIFESYAAALYVAGVFFVLAASGAVFYALILDLLDERGP